MYPPTKQPPWKHQVECWERSSKKPHFYIAHDMGAGKTKEAIDDINGFNSPSVLIVAPPKVILNWPKQFELNSASDQYSILALTKGSTVKKAAQLQEHLNRCQATGKYPVVVTNYETFWRYPLGCQMEEKNKFRIKKVGLLYKQQWGHLIFDEAHRLKSPGGRASWAAASLAKHADRRLMLSGTPMPHSPLDIYAQMRALEPSVFGTNFGKFKARYSIMGGFENRQVLGWQNLDELQTKLAEWAHYVSIDDALDLPETTDVEVECELDEKTLKIYAMLNKEFIADVDNGIITVNNALDKLLRLQQITTGHVVLEDGSEKIIDNNKIETLLEIAEDINPKEPIVIFYLFKQEGRRIKEGLLKMGRKVAEISGQMDQQHLFESGQADTALVQIQSGSEGLDTLTRARYCIYGCVGFSLGRYLQSRRRVWRPGQTRKVIYYHVVARNTVDKKIMRSLIKKQEVVNNILAEIRHQHNAVVNPFTDINALARAATR